MVLDMKYSEPLRVYYRHLEHRTSIAESINTHLPYFHVRNTLIMLPYFSCMHFLILN
jgi:hypothetical protein